MEVWPGPSEGRRQGRGLRGDLVSLSYISQDRQDKRVHLDKDQVDIEVPPWSLSPDRRGDPPDFRKTLARALDVAGARRSRDWCAVETPWWSWAPEVIRLLSTAVAREGQISRHGDSRSPREGFRQGHKVRRVQSCRRCKNAMGVRVLEVFSRMYINNT